MVTLPRHGAARHGAARHGAARHGAARHGAARHGMHARKVMVKSVPQTNVCRRRSRTEWWAL